MTPDLSARRLEPEWMDDPDVAPRAHRLALAGLARINRASGVARTIWNSIEQVIRDHPGRRVRILDLACGSGDLTVALARLAARRGISIELDAADVSPTALHETSRRAADAGFDVRPHRLSALRDPLPDGCDVIVCALFLHHLTAADATMLLRRMADAARRLVVVNDLERSIGGYLVARVGTRLLSRSPIVHNDGPASVAAAFTLDETRALAAEAGLVDADVRRVWPFRLQLVWRRQ